MKKAIVIVGVVAIAVLVLVMFLPTLLGTGANADMEIIFYDKDGNELGGAATGLFGLGVRRAGVTGDIDSVLVRVGFTVTTTIEYQAMYTYCYLEVVTRINTPTAGIVHTVAEHQMDSPKSTLSGTFEATYLMSDLLPDSVIDDAGKTNGWGMTFSARVNTVLDLADGTQKDAEDTCSITLTLTWFEDEFSVDSWVELP